MDENEGSQNISQVIIPGDLPVRLVSLARVIARLPDGCYTIELTKSPRRVQAEIVEVNKIRHVEFDQDDSPTIP